MGIFHFKKFDISDSNCSMKIGTDAVLIGAYVSCRKAENILDIGTGSGILALMLAQKSNANILAIEIDTKASLQAEENFLNSSWSKRLSTQNISIQDYCKTNQKIFELIVCNPPYFNNSLKTPNELRNIARHNVTLDFDSLLNSVKHLLSHKGLFYVILPTEETVILEKKSIGFGLFCTEQLLIKPNTTKKANRIISVFSFLEKKRIINTLVMRNEDNTYSQDYKMLTSDYYLNF